jgi:hypothetical protein
MFKIDKHLYTFLKRSLLAIVIFIGFVLVVVISFDLIGMLNGDLVLSDSLTQPIMMFLLTTLVYDYIFIRKRVEDLEEKLENDKNDKE